MFYSGGTESIAVTAGETKNPAKNLPRVVKNVFWRILIFYLLSVLIIGLNVPYTTPDLDEGGSRTSPFTIVFQQAGSQVAGSFINAVIMTSVISAGNHALFAGSRLLYTLATDGYAPGFFAKLSKRKVPWVAVLTTAFLSGLCFGASFIGAGQLWTWLQKLVQPHTPFIKHQKLTYQKHRRCFQPTHLDRHKYMRPALPCWDQTPETRSPPPVQKLHVSLRPHHRCNPQHFLRSGSGLEKLQSCVQTGGFCKLLHRVADHVGDVCGVETR